MTPTLDLIARMLFYSTALPLALFVGLYGLRSRWWITDIGRIIMGLTTALLTVALISATRFLFGDFPGRDIMRVILYAVIVAGLWHMLYALLRIQASTKRHVLKPRHRRGRKEVQYERSRFK